MHVWINKIIKADLWIICACALKQLCVDLFFDCPSKGVKQYLVWTEDSQTDEQDEVLEDLFQGIDGDDEDAGRGRGRSRDRSRRSRSRDRSRARKSSKNKKNDGKAKKGS